jgi:serine/threonine protein kinase
LATDGVYEHVGPAFMLDTIAGKADDLDAAARAIVAEAYRAGSDDNLTMQIVRVDAVPQGQAREVAEQAAVLPPPPLLEARAVFEGYRVIRELHSSSRSHIYLAADTETEGLVALKVPSLDLRGDAAYLKRFAMEEWVARRINSAHVLKPCFSSRRRNYLYVTAEFIEGKTLRQWMADNPRPDLETVRGIVEQIGAGLQAFHRMEIVHQDIRPDNVMIDRTGTVKIIDFGSVSVAGVVEETPLDTILGTVQYTAPEYFLGESGTSRADIFSLGVIAYQMLSGKLPYGAQVSKTRTKAQQRKLKYASALDDHRAIPAWVDKVLQKAVHPDPEKRYGELSEFLFDLRHPRQEFLESRPAPLMERRPLLVWQGLCFVLVCAVVYLLARQHGLR